MFDLSERWVYFAIDFDSVGSTVADLTSSLSADLFYLTYHSDRYVDEDLNRFGWFRDEHQSIPCDDELATVERLPIVHSIGDV